jgi:hypothetical protein
MEVIGGEMKKVILIDKYDRFVKSMEQKGTCTTVVWHDFNQVITYKIDNRYKDEKVFKECDRTLLKEESLTICKRCQEELYKHVEKETSPKPRKLYAAYNAIERKIGLYKREEDIPKLPNTYRTPKYDIIYPINNEEEQW